MVQNPCHMKLIFAEDTVPALYVICSDMSKCCTIMPLLLSDILMAGICFQLQQSVDAEC